MHWADALVFRICDERNSDYSSTISPKFDCANPRFFLHFAAWMETQQRTNGDAITFSGQKPMLDNSNPEKPAVHGIPTRVHPPLPGLTLNQYATWLASQKARTSSQGHPESSSALYSVEEDFLSWDGPSLVSQVWLARLGWAQGPIKSSSGPFQHVLQKVPKIE